MLAKREYLRPENRCDQCKVYACHHIQKERVKATSTATSVPQKEANVNTSIENVMDTTQIIEERFPIRAGQKSEPSSIEPKKKEVKVLDLKNNFVPCNICQGNVHLDFLTDHMRIHVNTFIPLGKRYQAPTSTSTSTSIVATPMARVDANLNKTTTTNTTTTTTSPPKRKEQSKIKALDKYKFRTFEDMCLFSNASKDKKYSDFTLVAWHPERTRTETYHHSVHTTSYKDFERFVLHFVYDVENDYYTISSKIARRGSFTSWDTEEVLVPERICSQSEIFVEVKHILLFYQVSPRAFFKRFLKCLKQNIIVDTEKNSARTENSSILIEKLSKSPTSTYQNYHGHGNWCEG